MQKPFSTPQDRMDILEAFFSVAHWVAHRMPIWTPKISSQAVGGEAGQIQPSSFKVFNCLSSFNSHKTKHFSFSEKDCQNTAIIFSKNDIMVDVYCVYAISPNQLNDSQKCQSPWIKMCKSYWSTALTSTKSYVICHKITPI